MAGSNYCSCAVCGGKTFYDVELHYPERKRELERWPEGLPVGAFALAALCRKCAETHEVVVREKARRIGDQGATPPPRVLYWNRIAEEWHAGHFHLLGAGILWLPLPEKPEPEEKGE